MTVMSAVEIAGLIESKYASKQLMVSCSEGDNLIVLKPAGEFDDVSGLCKLVEPYSASVGFRAVPTGNGGLSVQFQVWVPAFNTKLFNQMVAAPSTSYLSKAAKVTWMIIMHVFSTIMWFYTQYVNSALVFGAVVMFLFMRREAIMSDFFYFFDSMQQSNNQFD